MHTLYIGQACDVFAFQSCWVAVMTARARDVHACAALGPALATLVVQFVAWHRLSVCFDDWIACSHAA